MKIFGNIARGIVWFSRIKTYSKLLLLVVGGSMTQFLLSFIGWYKELPPVGMAIFWGVGAVLIFLIVIALMGLIDRGKGPTVTLNEAANHIAKNTFGGCWNRKKGRNWIGYSWAQIKPRGEQGDICVKGYVARSAAPQEITKDDWQSELFGFEMGNGEPFYRLVAGGRGQRWDRPFMLKSELYYYWPPIPLLGLYRKIRNMKKGGNNV